VGRAAAVANIFWRAGIKTGSPAADKDFLNLDIVLTLSNIYDGARRSSCPNLLPYLRKRRLDRLDVMRVWVPRR
jgi:hypothetical protein